MELIDLLHPVLVFPSFFKNGKALIKVQDDLSINDNEVEDETWEVTMHLMRTVDQKCCCLFQSEEGELESFFSLGTHMK